MPVYEYRCTACEHQFEEWQKISDPPVKTCPQCKKRKVEKLISLSSFQLKGGGWYSDLYGSSKPGADKGSDSSSDSPSSDSSSSDSSSSSEKKETKSDKSDAKSGKSDKADKADKNKSKQSGSKKEKKK